MANENNLHDETMKMIAELGLHLGEDALEKSANTTEKDNKIKKDNKLEVKKTKSKEIIVPSPVLKVKSIAAKDIKKVMKAAAIAQKLASKQSFVNSNVTSKPISKAVNVTKSNNISKNSEPSVINKTNYNTKTSSSPMEIDSSQIVAKNNKMIDNPAKVLTKVVVKENTKPLSKPFVVHSLQPQKQSTVKNKTETHISSSTRNGAAVIIKNEVTSKDDMVLNNWWLKNTGVQGKLLLPIPVDGSWYTPQEDILSIEKRNDSTKYCVDTGRLKVVIPIVEAAFDIEVSIYQKAKGSKISGDQKWINDVLKSGTTSDKVAALALVVQESPIHELSALDTLIGLASKKEYRTAQLALEAVKDLLIHNLLPDRHLSPFKNQPLNHSNMNMQSAILFWYEEQLLLRVERIADALDIGLKSTIEFFKKQCMDTAAELLAGKPEKEARFLAMIVNKLGDPSGAVGSKCIELLRNVIRKHPAMKCIVVREVRQLIYRPNLAVRSVHSGIVFLSQVQLVKGDHDVAAQLVECYMSLFEKAVNQDELGSRLLSSLLSGLDRAFPYLINKEPISKHVDSLFRIIYSASFTTSTRALMLISHIALSDTDIVVSDKIVSTISADETHLVSRFYRSLYAKLLSPQISTRAYNTLFLNLLFRSMKRDPSDLRVMAFLKRLGICALQSSPPIAAGLLFLMAEVYRARPKLLDMVTSEEYLICHTFKQEGKKKGDAENSDDEEENGLPSHQLGNFEASKREPAYAVTGTPALWEASLLRNHFHPSVKSFSVSVLEAPHLITFAGDPTTEFSLTAFLNRFAYKNPKKQHSEKIRRPQAIGEEPLNTSSFLKSSLLDIAPDKIFFHKFFGEKEKLRIEGKSRDRSKRKSEDDAGGVFGGSDDDEEDNFDERAIDKFATKLAEDMLRENDGEDDDFDDFSDSGGESDDNDGEDFDMGGSDEDDFESSKGKANKTKSKIGKVKEMPMKEESDDEYRLTAYGDDEDNGSDGSVNSYDNLEEEDEDDLSLAFSDDYKTSNKLNMKVNKISKGKKPAGDMSDFASAEDYEDTMEEIVGRYNGNNTKSVEKIEQLEIRGDPNKIVKKRKARNRTDSNNKKNKVE